MKKIQILYYIVFLVYISFGQIYANDLKNSLKNQVKLNDKIVFATGNEDIGRQQLFVMDSDGSNKKRLTGIFEDTFAPEWSPDGRTILYKNMGKNGIYLMDSDGKNKRKLISGSGSFWPGYGWSHDGSKNIFERYLENKSGIFIINLDGSKLI